MICEKCKKNTATTYIKRAINGVVTEAHLCSACAGEKGYKGNGLAGILSSMLGEYDTGSPKACPACHTTYRDIAQSGKIGCPECYKTFYEDLLPYIRRVHSGVNHIGKSPKSQSLIPMPEQRIVELRRRLSDLIEREEFETAAEVRDEIREIERNGRENG